MWSIERDARRDGHTICTAVAPRELVFTVRIYATTASYGPTPSAQIRISANRTTRSQPHRTANPVKVVRVRTTNRFRLPP
jgi:hypothetical protein